MIKYLLSLVFRARYRNVQSIIDCLEVQIEKPSRPLHQSLTWSEYKKCNTIKFLISCTPDGFVNFISEGFGGRTSDTEIVKNSTFLSVIPQNCSVLADRGFKNIDKYLIDRNCKLIRPPSVTQDRALTKDAVREGKRIASIRVHVERVIGRLREFQMLAPHACIDSHSIWMLDDVVKIACGIVNFQGSLIK